MSVPLRALSSVHPRACGEHTTLRGIESQSGGSSPRLRGTRLRYPRRRPSNRFIPAPAGNTCGVGCMSWPSTVHPRACGEHEYRSAIPTRDFGSSPRLRGTHHSIPRAIGRVRFIPAPAGNTGAVPGTEPVCAVHPRACGEHSGWPSSSSLRIGSSPRLRGTQSGIW